MLGGQCSPCCDRCGGSFPYTNPANEEIWTPSGAWPSPSWSSSAVPGGQDGNWFFFADGNFVSSIPATDWTNLCNWYSAIDSTDPSQAREPIPIQPLYIWNGIRRATTLPPPGAVVHIYSPVSTANLPGSEAFVRQAYFWPNSQLLQGSRVTTSGTIPETHGGSVFLGGAQNRGEIVGNASFFTQSLNSSTGTITGNAAFFGRAFNSGHVSGDGAFTTADNLGTIAGDAVFVSASTNQGSVSGAAEFDGSTNLGSVAQQSVFRNNSYNSGAANGGADFFDDSWNALGGPASVTGLARFYDRSQNLTQGVVAGTGEFYSTAGNNGSIIGTAVFGGSSSNTGNVTGQASFYDTTRNSGSVAGDAEFFGSSYHENAITGNATFNDSAYTRVRLGLAGALSVSTFITGNAVFNGSSIHGKNVGEIDYVVRLGEVYYPEQLEVYGDAVFNGGSQLRGFVTGAATLNDNACSTLAYANIPEQWGGFVKRIPFGTIIGPSGNPLTGPEVFATIVPACNGSAPKLLDLAEAGDYPSTACGCG